MKVTRSGETGEIICCIVGERSRRAFGLEERYGETGGWIGNESISSGEPGVKRIGFLRGEEVVGLVAFHFRN